MKTGNLLLGFAAGALAGVIAGILIAPHKGSDTRKLIKDKVKDVSSGIMESVEEQIDNLEEKVKTMRNKAEKAVNDIKASEVK